MKNLCGRSSVARRDAAGPIGFDAGCDALCR
jgi:hypothetical protein